MSPKLMTLLCSLNQLFLPSRKMRPNLQAQWTARRVHQSKKFQVFHGRVIGHEICAGSARLTKTGRKLGLRGLAVDKVTERSCGIDIMVLDLTVPSQLRLLLDVIEAEKHRILMIFFAPPRGTASRAKADPSKVHCLRA